MGLQGSLAADIGEPLGEICHLAPPSDSDARAGPTLPTVDRLSVGEEASPLVLVIRDPSVVPRFPRRGGGPSVGNSSARSSSANLARFLDTFDLGLSNVTGTPLFTERGTSTSLGI